MAPARELRRVSDVMRSSTTLHTACGEERARQIAATTASLRPGATPESACCIERVLATPERHPRGTRGADPPKGSRFRARGE